MLVTKMKELHQDPITSHATFKSYFSGSAVQEKEKKTKQAMNNSLITSPHHVLKAAGF